MIGVVVANRVECSQFEYVGGVNENKEYVLII